MNYDSNLTCDPTNKTVLKDGFDGFDGFGDKIEQIRQVLLKGQQFEVNSKLDERDLKGLTAFVLHRRYCHLLINRLN